MNRNFKNQDFFIETYLFFIPIEFHRNRDQFLIEIYFIVSEHLPQLFNIIIQALNFMLFATVQSKIAKYTLYYF